MSHQIKIKEGVFYSTKEFCLEVRKHKNKKTKCVPPSPYVKPKIVRRQTSHERNHNQRGKRVKELAVKSTRGQQPIQPTNESKTKDFNQNRFLIGARFYRQFLTSIDQPSENRWWGKITVSEYNLYEWVDVILLYIEKDIKIMKKRKCIKRKNAFELRSIFNNFYNVIVPNSDNSDNE